MFEVEEQFGYTIDWAASEPTVRYGGGKTDRLQAVQERLTTGCFEIEEVGFFRGEYYSMGDPMVIEDNVHSMTFTVPWWYKKLVGIYSAKSLCRAVILWKKGLKRYNLSTQHVVPSRNSIMTTARKRKMNVSVETKVSGLLDTSLTVPGKVEITIPRALRKVSEKQITFEFLGEWFLGTF